MQTTPNHTQKITGHLESIGIDEGIVWLEVEEYPERIYLSTWYERKQALVARGLGELIRGKVLEITTDRDHRLLRLEATFDPDQLRHTGIFKEWVRFAPVEFLFGQDGMEVMEPVAGEWRDF